VASAGVTDVTGYSFIFWTGLKFKNPEAPAVKREAEEDWAK
jgi:hypothetical protein